MQNITKDSRKSAGDVAEHPGGILKREPLLDGRHADNLGYVNSVDEAHKLIDFETGLTAKFSFCNADKGFGNTDQ